MNARVCRCCGQPISEEENTLLCNPNICAPCSKLSDGVEEPARSQPRAPSAHGERSSEDSDNIRQAA